MTSRPVTTLKVVDFKPFLEGRDKQGVANAIVEAFQSVGFVYLVNHGLPEHKISAMFEMVMSSSNETFFYLLYSHANKDP